MPEVLEWVDDYLAAMSGKVIGARERESRQQGLRPAPAPRPVTHMPFGKFKNTSIRELPTSYLKWLGSEPWVSLDLADAVADEWERRNEPMSKRRSRA